MTARERPRARQKVTRRSRVACMSPTVGAYWLQLCVKAQEAASRIEPLDLPRSRKPKRSKRRASDPAELATGARIINPFAPSSTLLTPRAVESTSIKSAFLGRRIFRRTSGTSCGLSESRAWQQLAPSAATKPGLRTRGNDLCLGGRC